MKKLWKNKPEKMAQILAVMCLLAAVIFAAPSHILEKQQYYTAILPTVLTEMTNEARLENELPELNVSPFLQEAAQLKANDMAANGYFAHADPQGRHFSYWIKTAGYRYIYSGENLAVNFSSDKKVTEAWLNSEKHRANILSTRFTEIGIATAQGIYKGKEATFVVVMFAIPMPIFNE